MSQPWKWQPKAGVSSEEEKGRQARNRLRRRRAVKKEEQRSRAANKYTQMRRKGTRSRI
jgi:hypothetical protein